MDFYSEQIGYDPTRDEDSALTDLLADLMHAYGHRAVQHCNRIALEHYQFEIVVILIALTAYYIQTLVLVIVF